MNGVARLYVHIGLPKTATTALQQDLFPRLESKTFSYVGVFQPREAAEQRQLYTDFCNAATRGEGIEPVVEFLTGQFAVPSPVELPVLNDIPKCRQWATRIGNEASYRPPTPPVWIWIALSARCRAESVLTLAGPAVHLPRCAWN